MTGTPGNIGWGSSLRSLPNIITIARMLSVAPLVWLLLTQRYEAALWLAFVAGASDGVDGFLAKRFGWQSNLGGLLDPLADKLLLTSCYVVLALQQQLPMWLLALVLGRDVIIVAGATVFHLMVRPVEAAPSLISKFNTCVQIVQVLAILVLLAYGWSSDTFLDGMIWLVAATTLASGIDYVWTWGRRAWTRDNGDLHGDGTGKADANGERHHE